MKKTLGSLFISGLLVTAPVFADKDNHQHWSTFHITITNTTAHQVIAPPAVIAHNGNFKFFTLGDATQPASDALATLAETGNSMPLIDMSNADSNVYATESAGAIPPGTSVEVTIMAPRTAMFSVAGMLATTNDGFMAATNIRAPKRHHDVQAHGMAYDAGSEMNNESCDYIPGPPCDNGENMETDTGEGFVTYHNGIHGQGDLNAAHLDWRGPAALISVRNDG